MAVPGQDQRDWDFATVFGLPIIRTVQPTEGFDGEAFTGDGPAVNSGFLDGMDVDEAKKTIISWLEAARPRRGQAAVQAAGLAVRAAALLGRAVPDRVRRGRPAARAAGEHAAGRAARGRRLLAEDVRPGGRRLGAVAAAVPRRRVDRGRAGPGRRQEDVPPRRQRDAAVGRLVLVPAALRGPDEHRADLRAGEREVLAGRAAGDPRPERPGRRRPVHRRHRARACCTCCTRVSGRRCCSTWATCPRRSRTAGCSTRATSRRTRTPTPAVCYVPAEEVVERGRQVLLEGQEVRQEYGKMGKSLKNIVTPDEMCERYGADTFRFYEMAMGPMDVSRPWATKDVVGAQRFLQRMWRNVVDETTGEVHVSDESPDEATLRALHKADRRRAHGLREHALQHGGREADRAEQPRDEGVRHEAGAAVGRGADGADAGAAVPARRRGDVAGRWATRSHWPTARSRSRTRSTWSRTRSSTRSRSTARSAAASRSRRPPSQDEVKAAALAEEKVAALTAAVSRAR